MNAYEEKCKEIGRTPEMEHDRIIQNLTVSAKIISSIPGCEKIEDMLYNAAESYHLLYVSLYPEDQ